jgi:hypothetical protein
VAGGHHHEVRGTTLLPRPSRPEERPCTPLQCQ